jgi:hypothetical protein
MANSDGRLQSVDTQSQSINSLARINAQNNTDASLPHTQRLAPTQRLSGVSLPLVRRGKNLTLADPGYVR